MAAAVPKCFYFQTDHWTGSVVQGQPPELWHWDGSYFFDKAQGRRRRVYVQLRPRRHVDPRLLPASRCSSGPTSARCAAARGS